VAFCEMKRSWAPDCIYIRPEVDAGYLTEYGVKQLKSTSVS
jgi:hypothetical protein